MMIDKSFHFDHFHAYDCKVYSLNKYISRKIKLQKRIHIDYLMNYEIRIIFRI